tara:strand:- start:1675 stop:1887 length:213 start_codon:yes stop_codon:yes gene_type:complete
MKKYKVELTSKQLDEIKNLLHDGVTLSTVLNIPESAMVLNPPKNKSRYNYGLEIINNFEISAGKAIKGDE